MSTVSRLSVTPVKGTRLHSVEAIDLGRGGARDDRRFFVIDARNRMVNSKPIGELLSVLADYGQGRLRIMFPDGRVIDEPVAVGDAVGAQFYSGELTGRVLEGPWNEALSEHVGQPVRILQAEIGAVDRGPSGAATLISQASLARLAEAADEPDVDARRFRMLIEIDGVESHAEDEWVGRTTRVGEAVIRWQGHVGRCLITSRDPETGTIDLPTLDVLRDYRGAIATTEPLPFGIYGAVLQPGRVRVGDQVSPPAERYGAPAA